MMGPDLTKALQMSVVDAPVAALAAPSAMAGTLEDAFWAEDKRAKQSLRKAHQAAAWTIKGSTATSFFNRASLLWLRQLQERIPAGDTRSRQDIN